MPVDAVIFDWGGTLSIFAEVDMLDMWRLAAHKLAPPDRQDEVCARLVEIEAQSWHRVANDQKSSTLADILATASKALRLDVTDAVLEEAATHHLDTWTEHITHDPDALPVLAALKDQGIPIALLSNTHWPRGFHEHFLERDGLDSFIDARLYTSEMTHTKPHPKAFREAMAALGANDPHRVVMVGDRPYVDIYGARMLGMRTVLRPNRLVPAYEGVKPDAVIERLPELLPLVDRWLEEQE